MDVFRLQINCIEHYQAQPTKYDPVLSNNIVQPSQTHLLPKVPVIRVFGATEGGQKVCAHIHGFFPYLYVEYTGSLEQQQVGAYIYKLHASIDHALALAVKTPYSFNRSAAASQDPKFVARITLVKGVPFYGFHVGYKFYLKIYMLNPGLMTQLTDMLQDGVIMQTKFQPYEAHIQYLSQFMIDYNLFGCDWMDVESVWFRAPMPNPNPDLDPEADEPQDFAPGTRTEKPKIYSYDTVSYHQVTDDIYLPRLSNCSLEVDIAVPSILNRRLVVERRLHHDFIERVHPLSPSLKLVPSMAALWKSEEQRRRALMPLDDFSSSPFPPDVVASMSPESPDQRRTTTGFLHEEEQRERLAQLVKAEVVYRHEPRWETFVSNQFLGRNVKTIMESVEDLYPDNLGAALGLAPEKKQEQAEVDEVRLSQSSQRALEDQDPVDTEEVPVTTAGVPDTEATEDDVEMLLASFSGLSRSGMYSGTTPAVIPVDQMLLTLASDGRFTQVMNKRLGSTKGPGKRFFTISPPPVAELPGSKRVKHRNGLFSATNLDADDSRGSPTDSPMDFSDSPHNSRFRPFGGSESLDQQVAFDQSTPIDSWAAEGDGDDVIPTSPVEYSTYERSLLANRGVLSGCSGASESQDNMTNMSSPLTASGHFVFGTPQNEGGSGSFPNPHKSESSAWPSSSGPFSAQESSPSSVPERQLLPSPEATSQLKTLVFAPPPPSVDEVCSTFAQLGLADEIYQAPFFSVAKQVPQKPREYGGKSFPISGNSLRFLPEFDLDALGGRSSRAPHREAQALKAKTRNRNCGIRSWDFFPPPPTYAEVEAWERSKLAPEAGKLRERGFGLPRSQRFASQIEGPTPKKGSPISASQRRRATGVTPEARSMSILSLEVHASTRGKLVADPEKDAIQCIFWCLQTDVSFVHTADSEDPEPDADGRISGIIVVAQVGGIYDVELTARIRKQTRWLVQEEDCELEALTAVSSLVRRLDPDIITGFELHGGSWGYLLERASVGYEYDLVDDLARVRTDSVPKAGGGGSGGGRGGGSGKPGIDCWGFTKTSTVKVIGRHAINIWRAMRGELALLQYSAENIAWHLLGRRIPKFSPAVLTSWWEAATTPSPSWVGGNRALSRLLRHYQCRTRMNLEMLEANELVSRTREQARVLGVDFFSVVSRGSQFKVESMMGRVAKPENFVFVSPSRKQVGGQNALECLPLVMEPQSGLYQDPVIVLDFQSLYPSVMIAYNYCYSTFAGRMVGADSGAGAGARTKAGSGSGSGPRLNKMGFTNYQRAPGLLGLIQDNVLVSPNSMLFVTPAIRTSLLAKMLREILETRVMIKSGLKSAADNKPLAQLLNNRQLALKLLANVTYGYTSASYSGRMPCAEIADAIVQTGRETLERAIALIHAEGRWGAEVLYGDTDSLFIKLAGRTRAQAFEIAAEMATVITAANPKPVKLKFEKVYQPCILLAKKRYVGYKWEHPEQKQPVFEAKGIETVRRDGTPAEQKIEEQVLRILFDTADLSQVKEYFTRQCKKIVQGKVSLQDFCFAKEVKLGTYSDKPSKSNFSFSSALPPGALVAAKRMLADPRAEAQYGERVPYLVIAGAPGARLADRCVAPYDVLSMGGDAELDTEYYITKNIIPPVERILNLVGASARVWWDEMPKIKRARRVDPRKRGRTLEAYLAVAVCAVCERRMAPLAIKIRRSGEAVICSRCSKDRIAALIKVQRRLSAMAEVRKDIEQVCRGCAGVVAGDEIGCESLDCGVFWKRVKEGGKAASEGIILEEAEKKLLDW